LQKLRSRLLSSDANKQLILFDLDGTLARGNVSFAFGRYLRKNGFLSTWRALLLACIYCLQKMHVLSLRSLHVVSFYLLFYKKQQMIIERLAHQFVQTEGEGALLLREELVEEMERAKTRGDIVWIASSSPQFLVQAVASYLGIEHVLGTSYEADDLGRYKKVCEVIDGDKKCLLLKKYPHTYVTAYSDSILDRSLLEAVQTAIAVFPDHQLKKIALKNGWKIME